MHQTAIRSGIPFWRAIGEQPGADPPLEGETACEVVVIGGGITGTLVGFFLSRAGLNTVLLDRGEVGAGSTAASTGLLQYELDTPLTKLIKRVGEVPAVHAYRRGQQAIDQLEELISELHCECGFARRSTVCLASAEADLSGLASEYECRCHFGFAVTLLEREALRDIWGLRAPGALCSIGDGEVDPFRLTQALLKAARSNGLRSFGNTEALNLTESASGVKLATPRGCVSAKTAVFCTGYFAQPSLPRSATALHTTYAVCSQTLSPPPHWPDRCLIWETARPYVYARQTPDGRALIGGEDTPFAGDHANEQLMSLKSDRLRVRFELLFPDTAFIPEYSWAGSFAETKDGLPFIGRIPSSECVYYALGYGGNGITFSMIAGRLIADLIMKRPNADGAVFCFER